MDPGLNRDYVAMLSALCESGAEFLLVGAYALAAHGIPRATGDMDLWIHPIPENAAKVWKALERFGAPLSRFRIEDLHTEGTVLQIGVAPCRVDIVTRISGVTFPEAWKQHEIRQIEGLSIPVISQEHLLRNKIAAGRPKDRADVALLKAKRKR
jgi:hypothetical protein